MSSQEGTASGRPPAPPRSRRRGIVTLLERWPFGRKLHLLVLVPVLVVAGMLAYVVNDDMSQARAAADTAALVRHSESVATLVDDLQREHRQALLLSVRHQAAEGGAAEPSSIPYLQAQQRVDVQARVVREAFGSLLPAAEDEAVATIGGLTDLRRLIQRTYVPAGNIDVTYSDLVEQLISGLGLGESTTASRGSPEGRLETLLGADAAHAAFETSVFGAQTGDSNALLEFLRAVGDHRSYEDRAERFKALSSEAEGTTLDGIERSAQRKLIEERYNALRVDPSSLQAQTPERLRTAITEALEAEPVYARQAEDRLRTTHTLIHRIAAQSDAASDRAWRHTLTLVGSAVLALVAWLVFSFLVRRSVARPVRILTAAARQVADATGKELARVADDESAETGPPRLREIPVPVRDEIGALAEAFNQVQSTASALLERQITVRANVEQMFGNIGHRVSNLASRQLDLIEGLERAQTDPATLRPLYQIDHIATRLRRNAESLQVIAGKRRAAEDVDAPRPTGLSDVLRAALSTIGGYERVSLRPSAEVLVVPAAVSDLTLMLAELLQNGVFFSPTHTKVDVAVRVRPPAEGAVIEIIDHGLGMPPEQLAEENARLLRRERLDLAPTHVLGLFVVGRIARRFGIGVELSRTPGEGVTSTVTIPSTLLLPTGAVSPPPSPTTPLATIPPPRSEQRPRAALVATTPSGSGLPQRLPHTPPDDPVDEPAPTADRAADAHGVGANSPAPGEGSGTSRTTDTGAGRETGAVADPDAVPHHFAVDRPAPGASASAGMGRTAGEPAAGPHGVTADSPAPGASSTVRRTADAAADPDAVPHHLAADRPAPGASASAGMGRTAGEPAAEPHGVTADSPAPGAGSTVRRTADAAADPDAVPHHFAAVRPAPGGSRGGSRAAGAVAGPGSYASAADRAALGGSRSVGRVGAEPDAAGGDPGGDLPRHDRGGETGAGVRDGAPERPGGESRPLRRRVRGATLAADAAARTATAVSPAPHPADAAHVRDELEDLEAATERARRDSARDRTAPGPQVSLTPEGPGNDG